MWWHRCRWEPTLFIDWYERYWSESSYFLSTRLSFGWLSESSPGWILFFYCQAAGWLVLWQAGVGSSVLFPDKGVRLSRTPTANPPCHLVVCFLSVCSQWTTTGRSPTFWPHRVFQSTTSPLSRSLCSLFQSISELLQEILKLLINLSQHQSQKANKAVCP